MRPSCLPTILTVRSTSWNSRRLRTASTKVRAPLRSIVAECYATDSSRLHSTRRPEGRIPPVTTIYHSLLTVGSL